MPMRENGKMRRANKLGYVIDPERRELSILDAVTLPCGLRKAGQSFLIGEFLNQSWSSVEFCVSQEWASLGLSATLNLREPNEKDSFSTNTPMDFSSSGYSSVCPLQLQVCKAHTVAAILWVTLWVRSALQYANHLVQEIRLNSMQFWDSHLISACFIVLICVIIPIWNLFKSSNPLVHPKHTARFMFS